MTTDPSFGRNSAWLAVLLIGVLWFGMLGYRDLGEPDEGRYAEIPREMVESGDWITPRLNGFKYFEKPAFQYWMTAASFSLFGESTFTARLWVAFIGFAGALWVYFVGQRIWNAASGFYGFLLLSSSLLYFGGGHFVTLDMTVAVFMSIGIGALLLAQQHRDNAVQARNWMMTGWVALALAVLTKGLIGIVLPGLAVVLYSLWQRDWALWRHLHLGKGLVVFLLLCLPWFISVSVANPEFMHFFFIHEHFDRYTTTVHNRNQPWWYFWGVLVIGLLPWLGRGVRVMVKNAFEKPESDRGGAFDAARFLWAYIVAVLAFFAVSNSFLAGYLLPIFPALAWLMGRDASQRSRFRTESWVLLVIALALIALGGVADHFASPRLPLEALHEARLWVWAAAGIMVIGALTAQKVFRHRGQGAAAALSLAMIGGVQMLNAGYQPLQLPRSSNELAQVLKPYVEQGIEVFSVGIYPQSLPFYLGNKVSLVGFKGELAMGIDLEPKNWMRSGESFESRWRAADRAIAIMRPDEYRERRAGIPGRVVYTDPKKVAVIKQ